MNVEIAGSAPIDIIKGGAAGTTTNGGGLPMAGDSEEKVFAV